MTSSRIVVFDLDGTLVDTAPDLINALNFVLDREGLPPVPLHSARNMIGAGSRKLIDYLTSVARPFTFSSSLPPSVVASCSAAVDVMLDEEDGHAGSRDIAKHSLEVLRLSGIEAARRIRKLPFFFRALWCSRLCSLGSNICVIWNSSWSKPSPLACLAASFISS